MYLLINILYTILDHITRLGMDDVGYWLAMHASSQPGQTGDEVPHTPRVRQGLRG